MTSISKHNPNFHQHSPERIHGHVRVQLQQLSPDHITASWSNNRDRIVDSCKMIFKDMSRGEGFIIWYLVLLPKLFLCQCHVPINPKRDCGYFCISSWVEVDDSQTRYLSTPSLTFCWVTGGSFTLSEDLWENYSLIAKGREGRGHVLRLKCRSFPRFWY